MRKVRNKYETAGGFRGRLRAALSVACSALIVSAGLFAGSPDAEASFQRRSRHSSQRPKQAAKTPDPQKRPAVASRKKSAPLLLPAALYEGPSSGDDPNGRREWFTYQRTYPYDTFPAEGRRVAWETALREKAETEKAAGRKGQARLAATDDWRQIGPSPTKSAFMNNWGQTSGRINTVAVSPSSPQIVLIGSSTGGIWRSTNGGTSFNPVSDSHVDLAVGSITFSKSSPSIVYAGMGDTRSVYIGSGILKSTDSGGTWRRVSNSSLPSPGAIAEIEVDPSNPNRVYAAQYSRLSENRLFASGFHISTDGGVSWTRTLQGLARDIQINPNNPRTIFVGMARVDQPEGMPAGVYKSTDSGQTFTPVYTAPYDAGRTRDVRVSISPSSPQKVYLYTGGFRGAEFEIRVEVSTNNGSSWTNLGAPGVDASQFGYNTYLHVDPSDSDRLYLGSRDIYKSTSGGESWTNLTTNFFRNAQDLFIYNPVASRTHPDQQSLTFAPSNPNVLFVSNDGGISKSNDGGTTYLSLNSSLTLSQFVSITLHPADPSITFGGTQDNGNQRRMRNSSSWEEYFSGDGGRTVINPVDPTVVFPTFVRGNIFRFYEGGDHFDRQVAFNSTFGEPASGARIAFYPPFAGNGVDHTLYFGSFRLFVSTDLGETWAAPAGDTDLTKGINPQGADVLSAIGVARSNTRVIYTGSVQGRAMVSVDGGTNWTDVTEGLPNRSITSITVDPNDESVAYATLSGYGAPHVFRTTNAGDTWTNITGNLPDVPVNALLLHPAAPRTLYVGTDIGIFRSTSGGEQWALFNKGIPPAVITSFTSHPSGLIQASTYGRGAYELTVNMVRPTISSAAFNGVKKLTISGARFGPEPGVLINGKDVSSRIKSSSDSTISIKGKAAVLGLRQGENSIVILGDDGVVSIAHTLTL
ncbi:MAG TPA: hypothetical protein VE262_05405 [Blastocatellia bacterium]|nr:hypothetical protein [Blastocatellia bacterium]